MRKEAASSRPAHWVADVACHLNLGFQCLKWGCLLCLARAMRTWGHGEVFTATLGVVRKSRVVVGSIKEPEALKSLE